MRYDDSDRESQNVEDRRNERGGGGGFSFPGGGGGGVQIPIPIGQGGFSITTLLIIGALMLMFGINPLEILGGGPDMGQVPQMPRADQGRPGSRNTVEIPGMPGSQQHPQQSASSDELSRFVRRVLADTEDVWTQIFQSTGGRYKAPTLVMFSRQTRTGCGPGVTQMGPFYCPLDQKVYIDLAFYEELKRRFKAPGDFAQAYVIAHEVGHHVQTLLGVAEKVQQFKEANPRQANAIQVRMELQADCLAGVWAHVNDQIKNRLQPGDIESGLNAAAQIGDDMIQKQTQGYVVPESFTHGSSAQRVKWFRTGLDSGNMQACDTFRARDL